MSGFFRGLRRGFRRGNGTPPQAEEPGPREYIEHRIRAAFDLMRLPRPIQRAGGVVLLDAVLADANTTPAQRTRVLAELRAHLADEDDPEVRRTAQRLLDGDGVAPGSY